MKQNLVFCAEKAGKGMTESKVQQNENKVLTLSDGVGGMWLRCPDDQIHSCHFRNFLLYDAQTL